MEEPIIRYEKQYPNDPGNLCIVLGYPPEETAPEELPDILSDETGKIPDGAQAFAKQAVWISKCWHIDISVSQHLDFVSVEFAFEEPCTFLSPYLSEMKDLIQMSDVAHLLPDYDLHRTIMIFIYDFHSHMDTP